MESNIRAPVLFNLLNWVGKPRIFYHFSHNLFNNKTWALM